MLPVMNQLKSILQETIVELSTLEHERGNSSTSFKKLETYCTPHNYISESRVKKSISTQDYNSSNLYNQLIISPIYVRFKKPLLLFENIKDQE
jgi:hypothetical protein